MRKLIITAVLAATIAVPATASADRVHNVVSIHADSYYKTQQIYGSVESGKPKCERNRTIKLFAQQFNSSKRGDGFQHVDTTTTNSQGEYFFFGSPEEKSKGGFSSFPPGRYFSRVTRERRGGDVCIRDDSRVIEIGFL